MRPGEADPRSGRARTSRPDAPPGPAPAAPDLSRRAGVGLKAQHYEAVLAAPAGVGWFEVHAENYMGAGGPPHHYLERIRRDYPLSVHGVGLSIGSHEGLDAAHLARLAALTERYQPALVSEHLAWSSHHGTFLSDLLPLPCTGEALARVRAHVDQVQEALGRRVLIENPSTYVAFEHREMSEAEFLRTLLERTGCGLLLDVNNVYVSAVNQGRCPRELLRAMPLEHAGEIHLAGHAEDRDEGGRRLLVDAHDREVCEEVWDLYAEALARTGPVPTLIEWDREVPGWPVLAAQAERAERVLRGRSGSPAGTGSADALAG